MSLTVGMVKLPELADLNPPLPELPGNDAPVSFVPMSAVDATTGSVTAPEDRVYAEVSKGYTPFIVRDLLVAKITPCFENGKIAQAQIPRRFGFGSTEFHVVRPRPAKADARFLLHFLRQKRILLDGERRMTGSAGQRRIPEHYLATLDVPLLPLAEQRRIAEVLDRAEALRAKRRAALAKLETLTQSIFLDLFGDPAANSKGWSVVPFGKLGTNEDSRRIPVKSADRESKTGTYPYYGASGIIDWVDDYLFEGERLLIAEDGANLVARTTPVAFIATGKYWVNNHAHVIAENGRAHLRFLEHFFMYLDLKQYISGTAQPKLNQSNLERIPVALPPISLQQKFVDHLNAAKNLKDHQKESIATLDSFFTALQYRAFKGELFGVCDELAKGMA